MDYASLITVLLLKSMGTIFYLLFFVVLITVALAITPCLLSYGVKSFYQSNESFNDWVNANNLNHYGDHLRTLFVYIIPIIFTIIACLGPVKELIMRDLWDFPSIESLKNSDPFGVKERKPAVVTGSAVLEFKLLKMTRGHQMYVDIQDSKTGHVYKNIFVMEHCSSPRAFIGELFNINVTYKAKGTAKTIVFNYLPSIFCNR